MLCVAAKGTWFQTQHKEQEDPEIKCTQKKCTQKKRRIKFKKSDKNKPFYQRN